MAGQGSPQFEPRLVTRKVGRRYGSRHSRVRLPGQVRRVWAMWMLIACSLARPAPLSAEEVDLWLRIAWGAGTPRQWKATVQVDNGQILEMTDLGLSAESPGSKRLRDGRVSVVQRVSQHYDGFDVHVRGPRTAMLQMDFAPHDDSSPPLRLEHSLETLISQPVQTSLDDAGNRVLIRRAPGDDLRVLFQRDSLIFAPHESFELQVEPNQVPLEPDASLRLRIHLSRARENDELWSTQTHMRADAYGEVSPIRPEAIPMPAEEGVYDVVVALYRRPRLDVPVWRTAPIAQRRIQVVVLSKEPTSADTASWREERVIDPANPGWRAWAARVPGMSLFPGFDHSKPLGNAEPTSVDVAGTTMLALAPDQWQAYPLTISQTDVPHILEIEYPAHLPQTLGISIIEPNEAGEVVPIGVDSGVHVPRELVAATPSIGKHRIVFWPRTTTPLILLTNQSSESKAVFGRLRVLRGPRSLPPASIPSGGIQRLALAYYDKPLFPANFSAGAALDPARGQVLDDWRKFYEGGRRLAEYLKYAGYNGAVICVAREGSAIYPSTTLQPTPKYDTGVFFTTGQDPIRKDVLELLFRIFDREGLVLIPAVHFSGRSSELEMMRDDADTDGEGIALVDGRRRVAPTIYNPLDERVQRYMLRVTAELTERYGKHPAFRGVSVQLAHDAFSLLPDASFGFDARTLARFRKSLPPDMPSASQSLDADVIFSNPKLVSAWLSWRADQIVSVYARMGASIREQRDDARLWLATGELYEGRAPQRILQPRLVPNYTIPIATASLELGIDAQLYQRIPGVTLLRPHRSPGRSALNEQAVDMQINQALEVDDYFRVRSPGAAHPAGTLFYHPRYTRKLPSFDAVSPFGAHRTFLELHTHVAPSGIHNRRRLVESLASLDTQVFMDGGWMLPLGQEDALLPVLEVYRQLPVDAFDVVTPRSEGSTQPVVVRKLQRGDRTYFYLVNDSPWPISVALEILGPADLTLTTLGSRSWPDMTPKGDRWIWTLSLEPYDLVAAWLNSPRGQVVDWRTTVPAHVVQELARQVRETTLRANAAVNRPPLRVLSNADMESASLDGQIPGWRFNTGPGLDVSVDREIRFEGNQSLHLRSQGGVLWVRSNAFKPPPTGRLYVLARLRTRDARFQPNLRVVLDDDHNFYWPLFVGRGTTPLPETWGEHFLFPFEQLPNSSLQELHLGFDLMGEGEVWIDDIQIFDMWIQREERNALLIAAGLASKNLERDVNVLYARRFLEGYWPQFLLTFAEPGTNPASGTESLRTAARERAATSHTPPAEANDPKRSTWDQMRDLVPKVPFKVPFSK